MNGHVAKKGDRYYVVLELEERPYRRCPTPRCRGGQWTAKQGEMACEKCGAELSPVTPTRHRKWHSGYDRKKDATEALHQLVTDVRKGSYVEPSKETFGEYLERWLPTIKETVRANTYEAYRGAVEVHLVPSLGTVPLRQLDRATFSTYYSELSRTGRKDGKGGLSPRSVRAIHVTAHKALRDAVKDNLLVRNPTDDAAVPAKVRSATPSWTAEQVTKFLASVQGKPLHPAFLTLATTGLRRSELLGLRWADIDLEAGTLAVRQVVSLDRYKPFLAEPKTPRSRRVIALDPGTVKTLKSHRKVQNEGRLLAGQTWQDRDLVFAAPDGGILHPQTLSGAFERAVEAAGLPPIGIHGLRHSSASLGLAAGVPLVIMSERLGHSSTAITGDVYSHSLPSQHQAAADQVAGLILGGAG
jgi:integrase